MADRLLLFGGSFDPVHVGHVRIARALADGVGASRVLLTPTGVNPLKPPPAASGEDRLAMLKLAVRDDDLFEICTLELFRPPPSYTIDTVEALRERQGPSVPIDLAMGADMVKDLPKWHRAADLLRQVRLVVACRPPMTVEDVEKELNHLSSILADRGVDSFDARAISTPLMEISSSGIREKLRKGESVEDVVQKEVIDYIHVKGLYGTSR
ncbi:MAG: nicotinate (nicotinamide) nucleotide adenylyltransferase [Phycisphaerae bacterium]|nr:nicotinate (nicotinamide) nucleotide adenylyltransferase [Phycisphaerae bacterium]